MYNPKLYLQELFESNHLLETIIPNFMSHHWSIHPHPGFYLHLQTRIHQYPDLFLHQQTRIHQYPYSLATTGRILRPPCRHVSSLAPPLHPYFICISLLLTSWTLSFPITQTPSSISIFLLYNLLQHPKDLFNHHTLSHLCSFKCLLLNNWIYVLITYLIN